MKIQTKALLVHFLTASGAVFAMLALLAAANTDWPMMVLWLVVALIVDGIDGPLARRYDTGANAPVFDGVLLDLVIDYLTYVFVPAFALFQSGLLNGWSGWVAILVICFSSALYFADTRMKTEDKSFRGFPGSWNMLVLVLLATQPSWQVILAVVVVLAAAMFAPVKFIHPVRTKRWRMVSLPVSGLWLLSAAAAALSNFHPDHWAIWTLVGSSIYLLSAGALQQLIPAR